MRRKRVSKRRWKARYRLGKWVPVVAVVEHRLRVSLDDEINHLTWHIRRVPVQ